MSAVGPAMTDTALVTRLDLLAQLNRIAGGARLRP